MAEMKLFGALMGLMLFLVGSAHAELLVLTRDGVLHHGLDGPTGKLPIDKPRAMAIVHQSPLVIAVAHEKGVLEVAGKQHAIPGKEDGVVALAVAGKLYALTAAHELVELDDTTGKRTPVAPLNGLVVGDGKTLYGIHDGKVEAFVLGATGSSASVKLDGHPIAACATDGKVFVATREGPLWQIDVATGRKRDLGLGGWWGTLAMAAEGSHLYLATQSGKLWDVDYAAGTKTALAMDGWQGTVALAVTSQSR